jgi:hypothetical protein
MWPCARLTSTMPVPYAGSGGVHHGPVAAGAAVQPAGGGDIVAFLHTLTGKQPQMCCPSCRHPAITRRAHALQLRLVLLQKNQGPLVAGFCLPGAGNCTPLSAAADHHGRQPPSEFSGRACRRIAAGHALQEGRQHRLVLFRMEGVGLCMALASRIRPSNMGAALSRGCGACLTPLPAWFCPRQQPHCCRRPCPASSRARARVAAVPV